MEKHKLSTVIAMVCVSCSTALKNPTVGIESAAKIVPLNASYVLSDSVIKSLPFNIYWDIGGDNTNMPQANVEFDVQKEDSLAGPWYLFCRTNTPPVQFFSDGDQGYFRVGVHWITEP